MKLMPLNHRFSTTINYHPKKYTYQNLPNATRKVSDTRRNSHLLNTKLNWIDVEAVNQVFGANEVEIKWKSLEACRLLRQADQALDKIFKFLADRTELV